MARLNPSAKAANQLPVGASEPKASTIAEAVSGSSSSVSPVTILQEQLAAKLAGNEPRWAPRTAFWVSVGSAAAIWLAIAAVIRASV
jgi:hypothetical protein